MPILLLRCLGLFENSFPPSDLRGTYGGFLRAADEKAIFKHTLVRGPWGEGDKERTYKGEKLKMTAVLAIVGLNNTGGNFRDFYTNGYPVSNKTTDMRRGIQTAMKALSLSMLTSDAQKTQEYVSQVETQIQGGQPRI